MKEETKGYIVMALLATALLAVGMFLGYLVSIITNTQ